MIRALSSRTESRHPTNWAIASLARRNRRLKVGEIARHTTQASGRPISSFTVARRQHGGGLFARRPVRSVPLTPAHRRRHESRFSLSSDSHRILIWRERGSRNHPSNIIERDRYGGRGVLVWQTLLAARTLPPVTILGASIGAARHMGSNSQQLIDTLILSMVRRCETCPTKEK
ncbi:transposable element Tcb1 transposase [Trichonephila clavipes]|nr:transposable element Tcb1 transposase [Trichonephila clavipes]